MWWGVFGAAAGSLPWAQVAAASASPLFVSFLLMYVSGVPLLEKSADERWGDDPAYQVRSVVTSPPSLVDRSINQYQQTSASRDASLLKRGKSDVRVGYGLVDRRRTRPEATCCSRFRR